MLSVMLGLGLLNTAAAGDGMEHHLCLDLEAGETNFDDLKAIHADSSCKFCVHQAGWDSQYCSSGMMDWGTGDACLENLHYFGFEQGKDTFIQNRCSDALWIDRFFLKSRKFGVKSWDEFPIEEYSWGQHDNVGVCMSTDHDDDNSGFGRGIKAWGDECYEWARLRQGANARVFLANRWHKRDLPANAGKTMFWRRGLSVAQAQKVCANTPKCVGFTYTSHLQKLAYFKERNTGFDKQTKFNNPVKNWKFYYNPRLLHGFSARRRAEVDPITHQAGSWVLPQAFNHTEQPMNGTNQTETESEHMMSEILDLLASLTSQNMQPLEAPVESDGSTSLAQLLRSLGQRRL